MTSYGRLAWFGSRPAPVAIAAAVPSLSEETGFGRGADRRPRGVGDVAGGFLGGGDGAADGVGGCGSAPCRWRR